MATQRQIAANKQNASKSSGPRTAEGKSIASRNAVKHGLTGQQIMVPGENPDEFEALVQRIIMELEPEGEIEPQLAEQIATGLWRKRRIFRIESEVLRVRPETLCRITEFSEHESNGRELDEGERVAVEVLPVLGQSAAAVEPGDGAFDHPTPGLDDEALHPIGSLDDLGLEIGQDAGQGAVKDRALIGAVGEQFPEKGKQTEQGRQQRETAVAILNVGGGDDAVQQQALRIDQNMPLLALDQLAGIEAVAVDASPPFSALFTL